MTVGWLGDVHALTGWSQQQSVTLTGQVMGLRINVSVAVDGVACDAIGDQSVSHSQDRGHMQGHGKVIRIIMVQGSLLHHITEV